VKLVQMNIDHNITPEQFAATADETKQFARLIAQQPGLCWKIWIGDEKRSEVGGIYLFESDQAARNFVNGPVFAQIKGNPAFSRVEAKLFDVNEECSAITRAPLPQTAKV
jgi:hypothetical protein